MANNPIPVYVFTGFLESGKTKFIQEILADPNFTENEVTALLLCEEGIEEYDEKWLAHYGTALVPIESEDRLTPNILKRIEQKYNPDRIIVEYNGMWKLESLMQAFPARWELYQIITTVDATTFEVYSNNIGPQMFEHITTADMVVFNRCTDAPGVRACVLEQLKVGGQRRKIAARWHDINGNIAFYAVCVRFSDAAAQCLVIEVRRCRAHSEALTGHIHCISAVGNAEAHLFGITRR